MRNRLCILRAMKPKNKAAVTLGRKGGRAGVGRSKARTTEQARKAALKRWENSK